MEQYRYFKLSEFDDPTEPGSGEKMDKDFLTALDNLRHECGFPFFVTSGYRTPEHNKTVGGKEFSAHLFGKACDFTVRTTKEMHIVVNLIPKYGFTGIGLKSMNGKHMIHLDMIKPLENTNIPRPALWTYP